MSTAPKIFKSDPIWHDNGKLQINLVQFKSSLHAQRWSPFVKIRFFAFLITWFTSLEMTMFYDWMTIFYELDFEIHKNCFFQGKSLFQAIKGTWFKNQPRQIFTNGTLKAWRSNPTLREPQELFAMSRKTRFWLSREPCRFKVVTICFGFLSWKKGWERVNYYE